MTKELYFDDILVSVKYNEILNKGPVTNIASPRAIFATQLSSRAVHIFQTNWQQCFKLYIHSMWIYLHKTTTFIPYLVSNVQQVKYHILGNFAAHIFCNQAID